MRDGVADDLPNLVFAVPRELAALLRLLRAAKADRIEVHHLADHPPAMYELVPNSACLTTCMSTTMPGSARACRWSAAHDRYCGEPDLAECEACVADHGHFLKEDIGVAALRRAPPGSWPARGVSSCPPMTRAAYAAAFSRGCRRSPFRTRTTRRRFRGRFAIVARADPRPGQAGPSVCVVGAIGVHKGYDVLLACARDAARRDLDLEFVVVGHTIDDARMMATGRVFVTGRFRPGRSGRPDRRATCPVRFRPLDLAGNLVSEPRRYLARWAAGGRVRHRRASRADKTNSAVELYFHWGYPQMLLITAWLRRSAWQGH